jgi:hypothetical protein
MNLTKLNLSLKNVIKGKREAIVLSLFFFPFYLITNSLVGQLSLSIINGKVIIFFNIFYRLCSEEVNYSDELLYQFLLFIIIKIAVVIWLSVKYPINKIVKNIIGILYTIEFTYILLFYSYLILGINPHNLNYLFTPLTSLYLFSYMFNLPAYVGFLTSATFSFLVHRFFTKINLKEFFYWVIISLTSFGIFLICSNIFFLVKKGLLIQ